MSAETKVKMPKSRPDLQGINKQKTDHGSMNLFKKGGAMKNDMKNDMKQDKAMIKKAMGTPMKKGGMPMVMKDGKKMPAFAAKKGGMPKFAMGGKIDGIAQKGKTRGKNC